VCWRGAVVVGRVAAVLPSSFWQNGAEACSWIEALVVRGEIAEPKFQFHVAVVPRRLRGVFRHGHVSGGYG
jgi:hypothetical protein